MKKRSPLLRQPDATVQITATAVDAGGRPLDRPASWTTSDKTKAHVANGTVTGVGPGAATITATIEGKTAQAMVTIVDGGVVSAAGDVIGVRSWSVHITAPSGAVSQKDSGICASRRDPAIGSRSSFRNCLRSVAGHDDLHTAGYACLALRGCGAHCRDSSTEPSPFFARRGYLAATANLCGSVPCLEMQPGSTFLTELNAGDETPGTPRYATWWSMCDQVTARQQSVILSGATNTQTACLQHGQLYVDATVHQQVRDWIR